MKISSDCKTSKILIELEKDEPWEKVLEYIEALQWLINGQRIALRESYQDRVYR